jgi:hypothetical protein
LSGLFSAECTGVKYQKNNKTPRTLELNMRSQKLENLLAWFSDIENLINEFGIKYSFKYKQLKEEDRWVGYLSISNSKENIDLFVKKIGFCYSAEKTKLANIWKLYRHYEKTWKASHWVKNRNLRAYRLKDEFSADMVSLSLGTPVSTVKYHFNKYHELYSEEFLTVDQYIKKITWKDGYVLLPIIRENIRYSNQLVDVYNLTSGASNRFFAGGFFTHNCEEMDYIDETALKGGIFPILHTSPDTSLVGFSTPTGHKTAYYELCEKNPRYKEFHYTYRVLPWADEVEAEKAAFTEEAWLHEYLAEWGTTESGVYQPHYVKAACKDYQYETTHKMRDWRYIIGTDWNEKYGTEICVLGFNPYTGRFKVVDAVHIERSEFTQLQGVSKVIEMNKKWKPNYIYIDAGNGSTNYELLRKTSWKARKPGGNRDTARILDILVKYDSGSSLEVKDPITRQKTKKPAKPFMVSSSVRLFEQGLIDICTHDRKLVDQLGNYVVDRISPNGTVVYGVENEKLGDHRLDAFNLACVGFHLQYDDLNSRVVTVEVGAVPDGRIEVRLNKSNNRAELKSKTSEIMERRLDHNINDSVLSSGKTSHVARKVTEMKHVPTNRPGWAEDNEEGMAMKYSQRHRRRGTMKSQRPKRTNI